MFFRHLKELSINSLDIDDIDTIEVIDSVVRKVENIVKLKEILKSNQELLLIQNVVTIRKTKGN